MGTRREKGRNLRGLSDCRKSTKYAAANAVPVNSPRKDRGNAPRESACGTVAFCRRRGKRAKESETAQSGAYRAEVCRSRAEKRGLRGKTAEEVSMPGKRAGEGKPS